MLKQSIYDIPDDVLTEIHNVWKIDTEPYSPAFIKEMTLEKLEYFTELGLVTEKGRLFRNNDHHIEWYKILQSELIQQFPKDRDLNEDDFSPKTLKKNVIGKVNRRICLEAPREHSKTTSFSVNYPLWRIAKDRNIRIILVSNVASQSESYLREVKGHIERDPVFQDLFGSLVPKYPDKWTDSEIIIDRDALNMKDPTVSATSVGGVILSRRADLIIVDDILNQKNTATQEQRQKLKDWFWNVLMPVLTPDGELVVVGTAWDADDLLESIIGSSTFDVRIRYKAIPNEEDINPETGNPKLLWDGLFTYDQLMAKKNDDPISFYRQYQNEVKQIAQAPIKQEWIKTMTREEFNNTGVRIKKIMVAVDPAVSEDDTENNAQSALVALGRGDDDKYYVLKSRSGYWGIETLLVEVYNFYWELEKDFHVRPEKVLVEDVQAQRWLITMLRRRKNLPAEGVRPTGDKTSRLKMTAPFFSNGEVIFLEGNKQLINQIVGWGREKLKDLVDAFVYTFWDFTNRRKGAKGHNEPRPDAL